MPRRPKKSQFSYVPFLIFFCVVVAGFIVLHRFHQRLVSPATPLSSVVRNPFPKGTGKIAIVLDDWGYGVRQIPYLKKIHQPLTISILPGLKHSAEVAQQAHANGHEVILHMPMEAQDPHAPRESATILIAMSAEEITKRLDQALAGVPFAKGISNHQGSRATSDSRTMEIILSDLKQKNLYFLDSFVTKISVGQEVARRLKVPFARRAVFLDNEAHPDLIQKNLVQLVNIVAKKGSAVAIGHDRPLTLKVLEQSIPQLQQAGYKIVPVSELTHVPKNSK